MKDWAIKDFVSEKASLMEAFYLRDIYVSSPVSCAKHFHCVTHEGDTLAEESRFRDLLKV